jgi:hypothetical protein
MGDPATATESVGQQGVWRTIRGARVFIQDGKGTKGPKDLINKPADGDEPTRKQTDSKAFRDWFGDSKVVDESGEPLVVYHGTGGHFDEFKQGAAGRDSTTDSKMGFFFTDDPDVADEWTWHKGDKSGSIMPSYVRIENPLIVQNTGEYNPRKQVEAMRQALAAGNDGVIFKDASVFGKKSTYYVALTPNQVKSATGNKGTFSRLSNRLDEHFDPLQSADRQARMEAVECYLGGDVLEGCGANGPGGKGFQTGNTCGADAKSSLNLSQSERQELERDGLYLHGTSEDFEQFKEGGHKAVYFSEPTPHRTTQAEHIADRGGRLLGVRIDKSMLKHFSPRNDAKAAEIYASLFPDKPIRDYVDYPDMSDIVKAAEKHGYNSFRVHEPAVQGFSFAVTDMKALQIAKRWKKSNG